MIILAHEALTFSQSVKAPLPAIWAAYADSTQRAVWSVPKGETQVYDESNFHVGGRDRYRCGPPKTLEFHGTVDYIQIVPESLIVHTDTVTVEGQVLAVGLVTWQFETYGEATLIRLTDKVTSFVGSDMIDGHRSGHTKALQQLRDVVEGVEENAMTTER